MEMEILKLLCDYSLNRKFVDVNYIEKLIGIIVNKRCLNDYVKSLSFTSSLHKDNDSVTCAAYSCLSCDILVDYESIKIILGDNSIYDSLFNDVEQIMFRNLTITQIILHELEHAFQNRQMDRQQGNSIEQKLLKASFTLELALKNPKFISSLNNGKISENDFQVYLQHYKSLYKRYYSSNPSERFAQINSYKIILSVIDSIKNSIPNLYEFHNASFVESLLKGYQDTFDEGLCPTSVFLTGTKQGQVWSSFDFYDHSLNKLLKNVYEKYSLFKRLSLGLPISDEEYDNTEALLHTLNKYNV